jgi:regulator of sigma E protease
MINPARRIVRSNGFDAVGKAFARTGEIVDQVFDVLGKLFSRQVSPEQLSGPVGIIQMSGGIAFLGLVHILEFMALIGVNLALLNLLPLVITDGGLLLFLLIEAARRKPLSVRYQSVINQVAIAFFIVLFVYVTWNDIMRFSEVFRMFGR